MKHSKNLLRLNKIKNDRSNYHFFVVYFVYYKVKKNVSIEGLNFSRYRWAIKILLIAVCMSFLFSLLSQTILSSIGVIMAILTILFFIFISVVFDMIGVAITCTSEDYFLQRKSEKGASVALLMKKNSEKVCSFCNDVVGDICGILSGACGASVILSITEHIETASFVVIVSSLVSALIAGLTIFSKALMKAYVINNANEFILKIGKRIENSIFYRKKQKTVDKQKN